MRKLFQANVLNFIQESIEKKFFVLDYFLSVMLFFSHMFNAPTLHFIRNIDSIRNPCH